jgi:RimJ/RimL family protein N-acetyltransferase
MEINTKRLTLRPIRLGDEKEIHEYAGDKEITMMFWLPNDTFEETIDFVKKNAQEWESEDQTNFEFVILLDGKIIGGCDIDLGHSEDRTYATLGWIINKTYRNQGYASEAASAILDFAFENLRIDKIYAQCDIKNPASFGVMLKIGMTCINDKGTRTYPRTGITSGEYTCMITREEWVKKSQKIYLRKMTEEEFQSFKEYSISDYAEDLIRGEGISREQAYMDAEKEFLSMLPGGANTEGNYLMMIDDFVRKGKVGWIWYLFEENNINEKQVFIADFLIYECERGKGYATAALNELEAMAKAVGYSESVLYVWEHNFPAYSLYQKCGYTIAEQTESGTYMKKKL